MAPADAWRYARRLSPFRWTWEWGLLLLIGFTAYSGLIARIMLGSIDLPAITESGNVAIARVHRWHAVEVTVPAADRFIVAANLEWTDATGMPRRAEFVRVDPAVLTDLGGKVDFSNFMIFATGPQNVRIRYRLRDPLPVSGSQDEWMLMPPCAPTAHCNVLVLDKSGQPRLSSRWRFFYLYDRLVIWLCIATILALIAARLAGYVGRRDEEALGLTT